MLRKIRQRDPIERAKKLCIQLKDYNEKKTQEIITELPFVLEGIQQYLLMHLNEFEFLSIHRIFIDNNEYEEESFYFLIDVLRSPDPRPILISLGVPISICAKKDSSAIIDHLLDITQEQKDKTQKLYDDLLESFKQQPDFVDEIIDDEYDEEELIEEQEETNRTLH